MDLCRPLERADAILVPTMAEAKWRDADISLSYIQNGTARWMSRLGCFVCICVCWWTCPVVNVFFCFLMPILVTLLPFAITFLLFFRYLLSLIGIMELFFATFVTPFLYNKLSTVSTSCFWNVFWKPPWIATRSRHRYLGIIIIKVSKCYLHTVFTDFFRSHKCGIVAEILARSKQWLKTQRIIANNVEWCFVWHACPHLSGMTGTSSGYCWLESLGATPLQLPPTLWRHQ